ncbi:MAG: 2'-5' RNA ligase family protein [Ferrovibrio sp.]|uniref:2'-5' RNA ligase family protein n=1 Tax=Ferrovibrio sp. TaxID=1917215 RepID=UPI00391D3660
MNTGFSLDSFWQQPARSYGVAALASAGTQAALQPVLTQVATIAAPCGLCLVPPAHQHLSLYAAAPVRQDFDKDAYWAANAATVLAALRDWAAAQKPVTLRFTSLRATPTAVIAMADDRAEAGAAVWSLRRRLAEVLPPPPGGAPRYDLIHLTLARYAAPSALPADFAARIAALPVDLEFPLRDVIVLRETRYPALEFDILATLPLGAPLQASPGSVA